MRKFVWLVGVSVVCGACGVDVDGRAPSWDLDELEDQVDGDDHTEDPPEVDPPASDDPPAVDPPAPPDDPPEDPPEDPPLPDGALYGLLVQPEGQDEAYFFPLDAPGPLVTPRMPLDGAAYGFYSGALSSCLATTGGAAERLDTTGAWFARFDDDAREAFARESRVVLEGGFVEGGTRALVARVEATELPTGAPRIQVHALEPALCHTLLHTGVCLRPQPGDQCVIETSPGPDDGPLTRVLSGASPSQRVRISSALDAYPVDARIQSSTGDLAQEPGHLAELDMRWFGSPDPVHSLEDFVALTPPEVTFDDLTVGQGGPLVEAGTLAYTSNPRATWGAYQRIDGERLQETFSYGVTTRADMPFGSIFLLWGGAEGMRARR